MKVLSKFFFSLFLATLFAGCDDRELNTSDLTINYGTSFGFCAGYCNRNVSMTASKVNFTKSGRDSVAKTCDRVNSDEEWKGLIKSIDYSKFSKLDTIIGCPDCADGGAEWIEIKSGDKKHKVVFEYGNAPKETEAYIEKLRSELKSFENCIK